MRWGDEMRWIEEGPYLPYIAGDRVIGRLDLNLVGYMIIIIRNTLSSISDQIYFNLQDSFLKPCGKSQEMSCAACLDLVGWTTPNGAARLCRWYLGLYPLHPCTHNHTNQSNAKATHHTRRNVRYYTHRGLNWYKSSSLAFTAEFSVRWSPPTIISGNPMTSC
jgi:hypothetical protein